MGNPVSLERESLFDFKGGQLSDQFFDGTGLAPTDPGIRVYNSPHGNGKFDLAYYYRSAGPNQNFYMDLQGTGGIAYHVNTDRGPVWINPNTFQLSTFGLDGRTSTLTAINKPSPSRFPPDDAAQVIADWQEFNGDNIANFATGRLDGFDWTEAVEIGTRNPE